MNTTPNFLSLWNPHFILHRTYLIAFSFRLTGSLAEAEDMVQETFLACADVDPEPVTNHRAWLIRVCSNRSLDLLKSAQKKRETYPGVWLPDAIPEALQIWGELDQRIVDRESLTTSFLLLLQKLGPEERVVYLLADILEYSFAEIADMLKKSEDACKKIGQRARKALDNQKRFYSNGAEDRAVIARFFECAKAGDTAGLLSLLAPDSEFWGDGGGKASVGSKAIIRDVLRTARFFAGMWSSPVTMNNPQTRQELVTVNGRPGLVVSSQGSDGLWHLHTIITCEVEAGRVVRIYTQRNPEKIRSWYVLTR